MTRAAFARMKGRGHRTAKATVLDGIKFPSKLEARVWARLRLEAKTDDARLYRQVNFPLLNLASNEYGKPMVFCPDFVLIYPDNTVRVIDAKAKRWKSAEWLRGKRAFEGWYGIAVEEVSG